MKDEKQMTPIRLGMVGGGAGSFIGNIHRMASRLDGYFNLVAGALSSNAELAESSGAVIGLDPDRCYTDYTEMAQAEASRPDGIEAVAIVTPNHLHIPVAKAFLKVGIHVICDKPLTTDSIRAVDFAQNYSNSNALFILTYNYSAAPMIREARELVASGAIGKLRLIKAEYLQDWLTEAVGNDNKQAAWRTNPALSGYAGALGDIGTHAYHLSCFVTGQRANAIAADITAFVDGREVNDNASVLLRYASGAKGMLWVSQVAPGNENGLSLCIYGDKGSLEWCQEDPNKLWFTPLGEPKRLLTRGGAGSTEACQKVTRIPAGHPEGYLESFATIYAEAAMAIRAYPSKINVSLVDLNESVHSMKFVDACLKSAASDTSWVSL